jgi:hypothetical protein
MEKHGQYPEATIRDTLDNIPIVVTLLVLANVAAAAAIGRAYSLVKRARARSTSRRARRIIPGVLGLFSSKPCRTKFISSRMPSDLRATPNNSQRPRPFWGVDDLGSDTPLS